MEELFNGKAIPFKIPNMPHAEVYYYPNFITGDLQEFYFKTLRENAKWQQDDIKVFGKVYPQPRLTALYANNGKTYTYSSITMQPEPFTEALMEIKNSVEIKTGYSFSTCLLNLYRNGNDSNGWHADNEKELGKNPIIASVSLGAARYFKFRSKNDKKDTRKLLLEPGSLLLMQGTTQHHWQHQLPKTAKAVGERINLTFRTIK
ncbi:MAG: alpha-ketoglutarate-dependent dioxygenase AlkB [Leeuwenhoekiella sp.]